MNDKYTGMPDVKWFDIPGYEGRYQMRKDSLIRSLDRKIEMARDGKKHVVFRSGIILSASIGALNGKATIVRLSSNDGIKTWQISRLVALTFHGKKPLFYHISYKDGDRKNLSADNIYYKKNDFTPDEKYRMKKLLENIEKPLTKEFICSIYDINYKKLKEVVNDI